MNVPTQPLCDHSCQLMSACDVFARCVLTDLQIFHFAKPFMPPLTWMMLALGCRLHMALTNRSFYEYVG